MAIYIYKGFEASSGTTKKGKIEAESLKSARTKLRTKMGIIPSEIKEEFSASGGKSSFISK